MLGLKDQMIALIENYGVIALFLSLTLETLGLPLPGESALITAAATAGPGGLNIWNVAIAAYVAAVLGDNIGYLIGRRYGKAVILRYGARIGITQQKYVKAEEIADRYGAIMVIVARFIVLLRQLNGLVAGSAGMHWVTFLAANLLGAALWVGFWSVLAYQFGQNVSILPWIWTHLSTVAAVVVPLLIVAMIGLVWWSRRRDSDITRL